MTFQFRTDLFVAPSETELLMLMRQILLTRIPLYVGDSSRKAREAFSVQKGRTIYPDVLNIREETF